MSTDILNIVFYVWCAALTWQLVHHVYFYFRVGKKNPASLNALEPTSIIVCARNERENLETNLNQWLAQDHSNFEVIVVNDGSTDGSSDFLREMEAQNPRLKIVNLDIDERFHRGKKFALTMGIKASKHDILLLTDADCRPASKHWLTYMTSCFSPGIDIVLGLGHYERNWKPLNWMIQLDAFQTAMNYINFSLAKKTYMGVGRNLAYRKELFFKHKGFASHQHLISGDDDLFVNEAATSKNVAVCIHPEAATFSVPKRKLGAYIKQKLRHYSTGKFYKSSHSLFLGLFPLSLLVLCISSIQLLVSGHPYSLYIWVGCGLWFVVHVAALILNAIRLGYSKYAWLSPIFFPFLLLQHVFIGIRGIFHKPLKWN